MGRKSVWCVLCASLAGAFGIALASWVQMPPSGGLPIIHLASTKHDFGSIEQGKTLSAGFPVTNRGGRRLVLVEQTESCCGKRKTASQIIIEPGEHEVLQSKVDTKLWCGEVSHTTYYATNDPKKPKIAFTVVGTVNPRPKNMVSASSH
jgi:hypothetical protein